MGTRLISGRQIADSDSAEAMRVAIVNEEFVRKFGLANAVGTRFGNLPELGSSDYEIIGVVEDSKWSSLREPKRPMYYRPFCQAPTPIAAIIVRTTMPAEEFGREVRDVAQEFRGQVVVKDTVPLVDLMNRTLVRERLLAYISMALGLVASAIGAVGVYGLIAYTVSSRRSEFAVRSALGASGRSLQWMLVRESALLAGSGILLGLMGFLAVARLVRSLLFGLQGNDPTTIAVCVAVLFAITMLATLLPARKAISVDPVSVLGSA
jgi:hypothetical protein